jgi:rifampicin phosphotransferase
MGKIVKSMSAYLLDFKEIDKTKLAMVGGKGANLGELSTINGIQVPEGFCITTQAYKDIVESNPAIKPLLDQLTMLKASDRKAISGISAKIRKAIEEIPFPKNLYDEISSLLTSDGEENAYAVRSSATAEDLPSASFAGQQDSYLNIIGKNEIIKHVSRCWASLFTDRAVIYRMQNKFDHRKVYLSVVIQKMIFPDTAGIMFTADPSNSNRKTLTIDAGFGLGEALVSGLVNADTYKVVNGKIIDKKISVKKIAINSNPDGGTKKVPIGVEMQSTQALTDEQILRLEQTGRKIEDHFGYPQDIEWCLAGNTFYIVQSRPVTTLYPIPETDDKENRVFVSTGHQQMMTDAMKPLGLSFFLMMAPPTMRHAGGRLFMDITSMLATPGGRKKVMETLGRSEPLINDALTTIIQRKNFLNMEPDAGPAPDTDKGNVSSWRFQAQIENDPAIATNLITATQQSIKESQQNILTKSGVDLFDFIQDDIQKWKTSMSRQENLAVILTAINAAAWINEKMNEWLGEKNVADRLSQSLSGNITSEMGLELLDVADAIRPYPEIISYLRQVKNDDFLDKLTAFNGGEKVRDPINAFLSKYGMRCSGEIDITKTRWIEKPVTLVPVILSNIKNHEPGASRRKFEHGLNEALKKEQELTERLRELPDGEEKAAETKRVISIIRNFAGYREFPKYAIVSRFFTYKLPLLEEARQLVQAGIIHEKEDIWFLTFEELKNIVRTKTVDYDLINKRKSDFNIYEKLNPPRMITSEGEIIRGKYTRENLPATAIAGFAVSSGTIEGRARVILNMEDADVEEGDILVTAFTDPSWTPLFVSVKGLVTEVGGLMTHGAVIAREYGLPAVVGVENATNLIKDGQRIRVNGTDGYVEIL